MSIDQSTLAGLEDHRLQSIDKQTAVTMREVEAQMRSTEKTVMQRVDASINKTREHLSKANTPTDMSLTEVKVYNFDDSRLSNQFDIIV